MDILMLRTGPWKLGIDIELPKVNRREMTTVMEMPIPKKEIMIPTKNSTQMLNITKEIIRKIGAGLLLLVFVFPFVKASSYYVRYNGVLVSSLDEKENGIDRNIAIKSLRSLERYLLQESLKALKQGNEESVEKKITFSLQSYDMQIFKNKENKVTIMGCKHGEFSEDALKSRIMSVDGGGDHYWTAVYSVEKDEITFFNINDPW